MTLLLQPPALIAVLFALGCPSAIFRRVRSIVVDAVQGHILRWTGTHIGKKGCKVIDPTVADSDTSATPIGVSFMLLVEASGFHVPPDSVFGGLCHAVGRTALTCAFFAQATATLGFTALKAARKDDGGVTAIAETLPVSMLGLNSGRAFCLTDNNEPSIALPSKVFKTVSTVGGMIEGHREPPVLGVKSRDGDTSPAQIIGGFASPLYHIGDTKTNKPIHMQDRAMAELGIDVTAKAQTAIGGGK